MTEVLSSARGIISLLSEPDEILQSAALTQLNNLVDKYWPEIATVISTIETLYEKDTFSNRNLAAVVASKVYYHLEELDESLKYALGAGKLFDINNNNDEYVQTLISKSIDEYIRLRVAQAEERYKSAQSETKSIEPDNENEDKNNNETKKKEHKSITITIDDRLVEVVERMFERCFTEGLYKQVMGIAIESRRLDIVKRAIVECKDQGEMLHYCFNLARTVIQSREFRHQVLTVLVELYSKLAEPDYLSMCQSLLFLNNTQRVAQILNDLVEKGGESALLAYQIGFDLGENQNQPFLNRVAAQLPAIGLANPSPLTTITPATTTSTTTANTTTTTSSSTSPTPSSTDNKMDTSSDSTASDDTYEARMQRLRRILNGEASTEFYLQFLYNNNKTDLNILKQIKDKLEARNSVTHNATVMAHSFMHVGTTVDVFLRDNLEWLSKAQNWAKFTATASIGVIHRGHTKESLKLLQPYLPQNGQSGSPYQEGGALYALGLIHANSGTESNKTEYLTDALRNAGTNEIVQHGACLGLGLTAISTGSLELFEMLKGIVMQESAVAGESAGIAMGLILLGSGNGVCIEEMLSYAHDTQHEKIIRGLAMGIALINYGREEEADIVIEQLLGDKDHLLRYGGMFSIGLAYACTSNNSAIQKLLHVAVSDVNDDVRRAAVINLGFVLANQPQQVPKVVALLAESYNPHVRYGAAMAVGIACAGIADSKARKEALNILEPLVRDRVDFVRQGAFIGAAMVLIQQNETSEPRLANFRKAINDSMNVKSDTMTKLGAILAAGIVDAGGRNVTIQLMSPNGHRRQAAIVGLALFPQFWYWYPLVHTISLSFSPTAIIGLNKNLDLPKQFAFISRANPSQFAYPPNIELKVEEKKKEVKHATLSITLKHKAKLKKKEDEKNKAETKDNNNMDTSEESTNNKTTEGGDNKMDTTTEISSPSAKKEGEEKSSEGETKKEENKVTEPNYSILANPARVVPSQQSTLVYPKNQRYIPIKPVLTLGLIMLNDTRPSEAESLVSNKQPKIGIPGISDDEPEPPQPFVYLGN